MRSMQIQRGTSESTAGHSRGCRFPDRHSTFGTRHSAFGSAFTLIELIVVITLIMLIAATALPTISGLFNAGADAQAYNIISAQIAAARALAIVEGTYAGVHVQIADRDDMENTCYAAVVWDDPITPVHEFALAPGFTPQQMPGNIAFGELSGTFVDSSGEYQGLGNLGDFTRFTIVFSPAGEVVNNVNVNLVSFVADSLFKSTAINNTDTELWLVPPDEPGVSAITLFDYKTLESLPAADRAIYLNENGQFMALNIYTGQFFYRY